MDAKRIYYIASSCFDFISFHNRIEAKCELLGSGGISWNIEVLNFTTHKSNHASDSESETCSGFNLERKSKVEWVYEVSAMDEKIE